MDYNIKVNKAGNFKEMKEFRRINPKEGEFGVGNSTALYFR